MHLSRHSLRKRAPTPPAVPPDRRAGDLRLTPFHGFHGGASSLLPPDLALHSHRARPRHRGVDGDRPALLAAT